MSTLRIVQVDAFTPEPFRGNPAAVCLLDPPRDAAWLQRVAAEMNLAETAFLWRRDDGFALRWFTPTVEVPLCGHATLASAHALWSEGVAPAGAPIAFHTASGVLRAWRDGDWIGLDFPALPSLGEPLPAAMLEALGAPVVHSHRTRTMGLVELESAAAVRGLRPDLRRLQQVADTGICVTARGDQPQYDFVSRFFAPAHGIDEDPVTGSAHCALAVHWGARLGRTAMTGYQASPRGGVVRVEVAGERVRLSARRSPCCAASCCEMADRHQLSAIRRPVKADG
ncbi:MAG: PhzF family phenazine biosynthesis protein [Deltaproteobacteria bacterium]|nr:PhzF family phenazine biosynthesis protein [Deltaproteobacteria bacterium]